MESVDWPDIDNRYALKSPNEMAVAIIAIIKSKIDSCFPWKRTNITNKNICWATDEIFNFNSLLIDMRDIQLKFPANNELQAKIDEFQRKYEDLLKRERSEYYCNVIRDSPNLTKSMWDVIKTETGKSKIYRDYTEVLTRPDGTKYISKIEAVNAVNLHFVNSAASCGAPVANVIAATQALSLARSPADRSLKLTQFSPHEVFSILTQGVAKKKSKDAYDISVSLIRTAALPMASILSSLYNRCIKEGMYPNCLKHVKVSPLYKGKGRQEEINSYRPVSIIPAIAKIFEYGLSVRLTKYLADSASLSERQHAYRSGHSTTSLARELIRRIMQARESRQQVAVIFCDLSKAFDVADHKVLASKLKHYGIVNHELRLLSDFMTDRHQVVVGEGGTVKSQLLTTVIGVAQGSSLSNIMFSLLLNDLPENVKDGYVLMYADDVAAIVTAPTIDQLEEKLNRVAHDLNQWFKINGLILNIAKTHFVQFDLSGRGRKPLNVVVGNNKMDQVTHTTFLGFQVDSALTWESHLDKLCLKIGRACFALWRLSAILPREMVRNCYFASVQSLLQYGVDLWACSADWERVFRIQKRAVRAIVRVPEDTSALPLFRSLKILTLPSLAILQAALYARDHLDEYLHLSSSRHAHKLRAPTRRLAKSSKLVHVMATNVYNRVPDGIKDAPSRQAFKIRLKKWLVEQAFYKVDDFLPRVE